MVELTANKPARRGGFCHVCQRPLSVVRQCRDHGHEWCCRLCCRGCGLEAPEGRGGRVGSLGRKRPKPCAHFARIRPNMEKFTHTRARSKASLQS